MLPEQLISLLNVFTPVQVFDVGKIDVPDKPVIQVQQVPRDQLVTQVL